MFYTALLFGLSFLCFLWKMKSSKKHILEPPELPGKLPLIGHGHKFLGDGTALFNDVIVRLSTEALKSDRSIKFYLGPMANYGITDPEDCLTIANTCLEKHYLYDVLRPLTGKGLFTCNVHTWANLRKLLNPAFNQSVIDGFIEIFNTYALNLIDKFANELGKEFNHEKILRKNSLETIFATAIGVNSNEFGSLLKQYVPRIEEVLQIFYRRGQKFWLHFDLIYNMSSLKRRQDEIMEYLDKLSILIIKKKKSEKKIQMPTDNKSTKFKPFVDLLLDISEANNSFTEELVLSETNGMIFAGHDTTVSALAFALTLLGSNAEIQERAYQEIFQVLQNSNSVDKEALSKLVYIEAIIKETLRLYPSAPIILRHIDKDIKLKKYTLKANTGCILSIYGMLRHKIWGPDAEVFRPERWLENETLPDPKYYAVFGLGRRNCMGRVYAMMSMKITLAKVLQKYRISSDINKMAVKFEITLKPASGHYISLEKRNI